MDWALPSTLHHCSLGRKCCPLYGKQSGNKKYARPYIILESLFHKTVLLLNFSHSPVCRQQLPFLQCFKFPSTCQFKYVAFRGTEPTVYWVFSVWHHHIFVSCKNLTLPFSSCCSLYFTTLLLHTHVRFWNFPCTKILGTSKSSFLLTVLRWMYTLLMISNPALTNIFPKTSMEKK